MISRQAATFRFYAELNDFLPREQRGRPFAYTFVVPPSVKDAFEAIGVPHPEVDLILVNGVSVGFAHTLHNGDNVSVYPVFELLDVSPVIRLRPTPLRSSRFIADDHLGRLARALRLLGFDTAWRRGSEDIDITNLSAKEHRIILTRNRRLLKIGAVTHGYWVRHTDPQSQVAEVVDRLDLRSQARPFSRCLACNGDIRREDAARGRAQAPARVREWCNDYFRCTQCAKLYWRGSHYARLETFIAWALDDHRRRDD